MNDIEKQEREYMIIRVPLTNSDRERFDSAMERGHIVKGRWVADAIREKLDRDNGPQDAA